jgi:predicted phosphodiesterase
MRRILQKLFTRPVLWASARFSSRPERKKVFPALDKLYADITGNPGNRGLMVPIEPNTGRIIIFSDQHKGAGDGADDFAMSRSNYLQALNYYDQNDFLLVNLGDSEELWENTLSQVRKQNADTFDIERRFLAKGKFIKVFGNHDLYWDNDPIAWWQLKRIYKETLKVYEGVIIKVMVAGQPLNIFATHGHQGDASSDGNWFSKFFVARIWAPLQGYLRINPNTPAYDAEKKTLHNDIMYEWSSRQDGIVLITGHTHQPVFGSLTHIERLYKGFQLATHEKDEERLTDIRAQITKIEKDFTAVAIDYMKMKPTYFNSGCCCFNDGDITGIEIVDGCLNLVKWRRGNGTSRRDVLESIELSALKNQI